MEVKLTALVGKDTRQVIEALALSNQVSKKKIAGMMLERGLQGYIQQYNARQAQQQRTDNESNTGTIQGNDKEVGGSEEG